MLLSASNIPLRKAIEETWPSAVARKLRMKRNEPGATPDWSGCGTIEGLNRAAASSEYSCVKYPPSNSFRSADSCCPFSRYGLTSSNRRWRNSSILSWRSPNSARTASRRVWTSFSGSAITRAAILIERWSLMRRNGRASTCVRSGSKVTVLRFTSSCFNGPSRLPCRLLASESRCFVSAAFPPATKERPA